MVAGLKHRMTAKSAALLVSIENRLDRIICGWLIVAGLAATSRIVFSPAHVASLPTFTSYMLLVAAPVLSTLLALHWFRDGHLLVQPNTRLAVAGRWQPLSRIEAERHPLYGSGGIMVSLLVGMMLNVPFRAAEYLAAIPPLPVVSPAWFSTLHLAMTFDAVLFSSLYMVAFVAALRRVPLFPRLLVAIWVCDLGVQLFIAKLVAGTVGLPSDVAMALHSLLEGNSKKVLISMALWLPYLLLSTRVNVTYRHRVPA